MYNSKRFVHNLFVHAEHTVASIQPDTVPPIQRDTVPPTLINTTREFFRTLHQLYHLFSIKGYRLRVRQNDQPSINICASFDPVHTEPIPAMTLPDTVPPTSTNTTREIFPIEM